MNGTNGTYALQNYSYNATTGNLSIRAGVNYTYGDTNHDHAVTQMGSDSYTYDANGNQVTRYVSGSSYTLSYDAENWLVGVTGAASATFVYDGDGNRVKATVGTATTTYVGSYFEWTGSTSTMKKYYYAGSTRVAMRTGSSTINYLLGDHLGSQAITTNSSGVKSAEVRYYPWGNTRYTSGTTPTTFKFTGQRYESGIGLYFYNARWYDSSAGRFISADTMVPGAGNPQAFDRYAYTLNNPLRYTDPSGHYGEEVHRDLTYQIVHDTAMNIADEEGWGLQAINAFADLLASEVVRGDMAADSMNPDGTINLDYIYMNPISPPGYVTTSDSILNSKIIEIKNSHWYTTPEAAEDMQNSDNPFDFGIASHEYQDLFSHWQKLGEPDTPIGIWVAHALNNPYKLIEDTRGVDYFEPGTATEDRRIDNAMVNGYTSLVDSFVRTQINNWSYDGR